LDGVPFVYQDLPGWRPNGRASSAPVGRRRRRAAPRQAPARGPLAEGNASFGQRRDAVLALTLHRDRGWCRRRRVRAPRSNWIGVRLSTGTDLRQQRAPVAVCIRQPPDAEAANETSRRPAKPSLSGILGRVALMTGEAPSKDTGRWGLKRRTHSSARFKHALYDPTEHASSSGRQRPPWVSYSATRLHSAGPVPQPTLQASCVSDSPASMRRAPTCRRWRPGPTRRPACLAVPGQSGPLAGRVAELQGVRFELAGLGR